MLTEWITASWDSNTQYCIEVKKENGVKFQRHHFKKDSQITTTDWIKSYQF